MRIYLVRVQKAEGGDLFLEQKTDATTADTYVAISHVWGTPSTITQKKIPGVKWEVALSPGKSDILSILHRPEICGSCWFWMDLFCIDQRDTAAIPISDQLAAIPAIYKAAKCVKVLIEHPVCRDWRDKAVQVMSRPDASRQDFRGWEIHHARRCQCMLVFDPWFERLWTRQEGLYAKETHMITLNEVECPRLKNEQQTGGEKWRLEGISAVRRQAVDNFVMDKIRYHGIQEGDGYDKVAFRAYVDLVYRGKLDIAEYPGSCAGPDPRYSPLESAWRSGRTTTKPRDYVLAILPDTPGYRVPPEPRKMTFSHLVQDGFEQLSKLTKNMAVVVKVPGGLIDPAGIESLRFRLEGSMRPVVSEIPTNVTEAMDAFSAIPAVPELLGPRPPLPAHSDEIRWGKHSFRIIAEGIILAPTEITRAGLPTLLSAWESTAAVEDHLVGAAPSGPCTGSSRILTTQKDLLYREFASHFAKTAVARSALVDKTAMPVAHGVVDPDKIQVSEEETSQYLRRYLACLLCGISLRTAEQIINAVEFCVVPYEGSQLLAIVNKHYCSRAGKSYTLACGAVPAVEGLLLLTEPTSDKDGRVVGRTWIPKSCSRMTSLLQVKG